MLKRRQSASYVLTCSGFLLEYKDNDPIANPEPSLALKLLDCDLGPSPAKSGKAGFSIRGKDSGKMVGRTHEYTFVTDSMGVAEQWYAAIDKFTGVSTGVSRMGSAGSSSSAEVKSPATTTSAGVTSPIVTSPTVSSASPSTVYTSPTATTPAAAPEPTDQLDAGEETANDVPVTTEDPPTSSVSATPAATSAQPTPTA
jgi:hypothetical protein